MRCWNILVADQMTAEILVGPGFGNKILVINQSDSGPYSIDQAPYANVWHTTECVCVLSYTVCEGSISLCWRVIRWISIQYYDLFSDN